MATSSTGVSAPDPSPPTTLPEVFANASLPPEPVRGAFGVCYVAFAGDHAWRYRGERLLEAAAAQARAAAAAHGAVLQQCVITDQPERARPYVDLVLPLRTHLDAAPFRALCGEYARRFGRGCRLFFGYMAKAMAVLRAPYEITAFVDTDTFLCDAAPLLALPRIMAAGRYDLLVHLPRTSQGWLNSGVLVSRRSAAGGWAGAWLAEFLSLDDFGDQLHLLKVLASLPSLRVGELPVELHYRFGAVPAGAAAAPARLPVTRGPTMLVHSKGLASTSEAFLPFLAARSSRAATGAPGGAAGAADSSTDDAALVQLRSVLGQPDPGAAGSFLRRQEAVYSPRVLAGFCAMLNERWPRRQGPAAPSRQLVLNANGSCGGCTRLPFAAGSVGTISTPAAPGVVPFRCSQARGGCGVTDAQWPAGDEPSLPDWYRAKRRPPGGGGRSLTEEQRRMTGAPPSIAQ